MNNDDSEEFGNVAPNTQHNNEQDVSIDAKESEWFGCFDPGERKIFSQ